MTEAQGAQVIALLEAILDALTAPVGETESDAGCSHPEDARVDLSSMGVWHQQCRAVLPDGSRCGAEFGPVSLSAE